MSLALVSGRSSAHFAAAVGVRSNKEHEESSALGMRNLMDGDSFTNRPCMLYAE